MTFSHFHGILRKIILLIVIASGSAIVSANSKLIKLVAPDNIPPSTTPNKKGITDNLIKFITQTNDNNVNKFKIVYMPFSRSIRELRNGNQDCFIGASGKGFKEITGQDAATTQQYMATYWTALSLKTKEKIKGFENIPADRAASLLGIDLDIYPLNVIPNRDKLDWVPESTTLIKMLRAERIDVVLIPIAVGQMFTEFHYDENTVTEVRHATIACNSNTVPHQAILKLDKLITEFKKLNLDSPPDFLY